MDLYKVHYISEDYDYIKDNITIINFEKVDDPLYSIEKSYYEKIGFFLLRAKDIMDNSHLVVIDIDFNFGDNWAAKSLIQRLVHHIKMSIRNDKINCFL